MQGDQQRRMRAIGLFLLAFLLIGFSYLFFVLSVHGYCEDRPFILTLAVAGAVLLYFVLRGWPRGIWLTTMALVAAVLCLSVIGFNCWYFVWAMKTCASQ